MSEAASITVAVRIRPPTPGEQDRLQGYDDLSLSMPFLDGNLATPKRLNTGKTLRHIVKCMDDQVLVFDPPDEDAARSLSTRGFLAPGSKRYKDQRYKFDRVFDERASQQEVFEHTTKSLLDGIFNGFNATVFAYGATGCGKTHTISGTLADQGVIYRTMNELFNRIDEMRDETIVELSVTYLEIYNENIRDLLTDGTVAPPRGGLQLREDKDSRITVANLVELRPTTAEEVQEIVHAGNMRRTQSPTHANETSSRSHAVLQVNVVQSPRTASTTETRLMATLSIIDLAGSERASATKNMGERMVEGANINKSLLALGNCINALCESGGRTRHIPYRNSKLTRLLKFSLGGNCRTVMIVCVAPTSVHYDDTQNTLKYANRAKEIKTKVSKNLINVDRHVAQYVEAIQRLNSEVAELKAKLAGKLSTENEVEKRRKADARVDADKAKKDMCAKTEQARPVICDGASHEATREAADIVLRTVRPRLIHLEAEAARGPLPPDMQAERDYLVAMAAPHQTLLQSESSRQSVQRSENTRSMLEATFRAVSERRSANLDDVSVENIKLLSSFQRSETEVARVSAREQALKGALAQQSQMMTQMMGVLAQCTVALRDGAKTGDESVRATLTNAADVSHSSLMAVLGTDPAAIPTFTLNVSTYEPPSIFPTSTFAVPSKPAAMPPRKRASLMPVDHHKSPGRRLSAIRSPRKSLVRRQSTTASASMPRLGSSLNRKPAVEKKSLRWADEAGEGSIDDAGKGGNMANESSSSQKPHSSSPDTEWEDEKTDDSISVGKDNSLTLQQPRRPRSSRFDPGYLKSQQASARRLSSLGEEDEDIENKFRTVIPKKADRKALPLSERINLPSPEESDESSITSSDTFKPRVPSSPPLKFNKVMIAPLSASKPRRLSNIGPIRMQKSKRRSSLIPQPPMIVAEPTDASMLRTSVLGGAPKRVLISNQEAIGRSPMKKSNHRISSLGGRMSLSASTSARGPFRASSARFPMPASVSMDPNTSLDNAARNKAAWR
ncbi:kinesin-domain-containing protein [Calocera viscosa TUFC12733]|uniref:Kinesin-domain-containing protein n=1 Tax=Calocera viscosa (strain TUFC12733) TaxID=1330018 RepID=A0A167NRG0_CALVF|nr:kinesin-domain-containing protein [Calocera viscosa TUFC12733]